VTPADHSRLGIWESKNGAQTWKLLKEVTEANGATDLEMDPQNPNVLFASFWGDKIYKSTNGGASWTPIMNGLPAGDYAAVPTRFALSTSHPAGNSLVLYAGFDWVDLTGAHRASRVFRSNDGGANWSVLPLGTAQDRVLDYCGLEFESACVEFHRTERKVNSASAEQVRQPIYREGVDQWRHYEPWLVTLRDALGDALARYLE